MTLSANEYLEFLNQTYYDYVTFLLEKYGPASVDYFTEKSYADFKSGLRKSPSKNSGISRTAEGLYCHHIDENKQILISTNAAILRFDIPYEYQKKDRLVYCNLIEHAILHIKIAVEQQNNHENNQSLGIGGYVAYIRPMLIDWLCNENVPSLPWQKHCYDAIYMDLVESNILIQGLDDYLLNNYPITKEQLLTSGTL